VANKPVENLYIKKSAFQGKAPSEIQVRIDALESPFDPNGGFMMRPQHVEVRRREIALQVTKPLIEQATVLRKFVVR
jgi:hypothetical protein